MGGHGLQTASFRVQLSYCARVRSLLARKYSTAVHTGQSSGERIRRQARFKKSRIRNLRAMKHRLEAISRPLGRTCLLWAPLVETSAIIANQTVGSAVSRDFVAWLNNVSGDRGETPLLAGMLADASDEGIQFIRTVDHARAQPARLHWELDFFLQKIDRAFVGRRCVESGYTKHMIDTFKIPIYCQLPGGVVTTLGSEEGIAEDVIESCCRRLAIWVKNCKLAAQAEFPCFTLTKAFSVFAVGIRASMPQAGSTDRGCTVVTDEVLQSLRRMAQAFHLSEHQFVEQYKDLEPRAVAIARERGILDNDAGVWSLLLEQLAMSRSASKNHPVDVLEEGLEYWVGSGISTAGCEQDFAKTRRDIGPARQGADETTEDFIIRLVVELKYGRTHASDCDDSKLAVEARKIWAVLYPRPRVRLAPKRRLDLGIKHKRSTKEGSSMTEAMFIRQRRMDAASGLARTLGSKKLIVDAMEVEKFPEWSESHAAEQAFQRNKIEMKQVQAYMEGQLLRDEVDAPLAARVVMVNASAAKNEATRGRATQLAKLRSHGGIQSVPQLERLWQNRKVAIEIPEAPDVLKQKLASRFNMELVLEYATADVIIGSSIQRMERQRAHWAMVLRGGSLANRDVKQIQAFHAALAVPRTVFFSRRFVLAMPNFLEFVGRCVSEFGPNKWKLLKEDVSAFRAAKAAAVKKKKSASVVGVIQSGEAESFNDLQHVFTLAAFMDFIVKSDHARSRYSAGSIAEL